MISRAVLDWIRCKATSGSGPSVQTIHCEIWERADQDRPRARTGLRAEPPPQNPLWVLDDASVEFVSASGALEVFTVRARTPVQPGSEYLTLDAALAGKKSLVSGADKGGSVPVISVRNRYDSRVPLMVGEVLVGCKQDRVINKSIMVGPRIGLSIPVSCVEAGRWRSRSRRLGSSGHSTYAAIAVFQFKSGVFVLVDSPGKKRLATRDLECVLTMREGKVVYDLNGLSVPSWSGE